MFKFLSVSLARRLTLGFASVLILNVAVAVVSYATLKGMDRQLLQVNEVNNQKTALANQLMYDISNLAIHARNVVMLLDVASVDKEVEIIKGIEQQYLKDEAALLAAFSTLRGAP